MCAPNRGKRVAIKRRIQMRFANVLLGSINARRRNRGGHLEGCLQRLGHHRDITWTILKRLGVRVFEIRTRLQIGPPFSIRESLIRPIGREHTGKRSKRSWLRLSHACSFCVPNSRDSACSWTSARSCSWRTPRKRGCQSRSHRPSAVTRPIVSPLRRCRPALRRPSVRRSASHLHRRLRGPSASCTCTSAMHRAMERSKLAPVVRKIPRNDTVLEVAPVLRLLPRCHRPLLHRADSRYQLCGDGTRAVLSRHAAGVLTGRNMGKEADYRLLRLGTVCTTFLCTCLILGLGPQTKTPHVTTHHGLVTSHCITLILRGQNHHGLGKSQTRENWGPPHTNPPLACNTQPYTAQITPNIKHKHAPTCSHETMPRDPSWRPSPRTGNPRQRGRDYRRHTHTPPAGDRPR